ncbi:MAG: tetratricopeptide repeat protein [Prolixibacteraceae bacterium]|nr:tetratricopeptide repeat protein [Prolixibacteraceae bacterium]
MTRGFHNLTAHYNVYFNGNEAMKNGLMKIEEDYEEDYTRILPIFKESLPGTETVVTSDMNRAIDKATKLIRLHSITAQPESNRKQRNARKRKPVKAEYNNWVDDAFIMMGRAYLYKKEYLMASSTFTQMLRKYKDEPEKYDAYVWLIHTYNEAGRYTEARELIETMEGTDQFPEKLEGELAILAADLNMRQQQYDEAIQYLNIGLQQIKGNSRKARYNYILGQLYQEQGNSEKALEAYQRVIRRRPDYEMMFNARINSAGAFSGNGDVAGLRKELLKMSKKKRNEPYLSQIYYALGNIMYNEGQIDNAIDMYKKSAALALDNNFQRAESCLTLANIYFERKDYIPAGQYYDSAMVVIDENYPNYNAIAGQYKSLNMLVENLLTVETQDSLQYLAALSDAELDAKINKWIEEEQRRIEAEEAAMAAGNYGSTYGSAYGRRQQLGNRGGGWYYYNPSTVSYGKQEFQRLWGTRKNEDNWRRSDKSETMFAEIMDGETAEGLDELIEAEEPRIDDPTTREFYMQDIPNSDSLMTVSHNKIRDALFNSGNIFRDDFNDFERSIESFKDLNKRYPGNMYELPAYFYLWDLYEKTSNPDSASYYKELIIDNYPESNYAKYLINPNFFIEEEARKDSMNQLYSQAFMNYARRDFNAANRYSNMVLTMQPDADLKSKARFISVVAGSRNYKNTQFADSLKSYISRFPGAEPTPLAKQILTLVEEQKLENYEELVETGYLNDVIKNLEIIAAAQENADTVANQKWDTDTELLHYFVIAFPNSEKIDVNRLKFDIANYNLDHYTSLDFDIETENLNSEIQLIVVRNFFDKESALIYFLSIIRKPEVFKTLAGQKFYNFVVSNNNFREMLSNRSYDNYLKFFVKNYSIHTSGEFPEDALESPEELMAKLREDKTKKLQDQGEFVVVEADETLYEVPEAAEKIYELNYAEPHSFMLLINEARFRTGFLMRNFVRYNAENHRNKRLRVVPLNLKEQTLLLVSQFNDAYDALLYKNKVDENASLFEPVKDVDYQTFVIGENNLKKLRETNNVEAWNDYYRRFYIYSKVPGPEHEPQKETEPETTTPEKEENISDPKTNEPVDAQSTEQTEGTDTEQVKEQEQESEEKADTLTSESEPSDSSQETETLAERNEEQSEAATQKPESKPQYEGEYTFDAEAMHNVVYVLPKNGSNQNLLITYLRRMNTMQFSGKDIKINTEDFDDFRILLVVSGLGNKDEAQRYHNTANNDSRVKMALRNANHKSYVMGIENLVTFKQEKDINGYQSFYEKHY